MRTLLMVCTCAAVLGALSTVDAQTAPAAPPQGQAASGQATPAQPAPGQAPAQTAPAPPNAGDAATPVQGPTFRTGVEIIAVDVGVVDRRGRPVEDLRAPDFSVKVNGEVRRVVSAELVKVDVE